MLMKFIRSLIISLTILIFGFAANAQSTLDKILQSGTLKVGTTDRIKWFEKEFSSSRGKFRHVTLREDQELKV